MRPGCPYRSGHRTFYAEKPERTALYESKYGGFLTTVGEYDRAESLLVHSYTVLREARGPDDPATHRALSHLVELYEAWDKPEQAAEYRAKSPPKPPESR